jgi:hypothetical protein
MKTNVSEEAGASIIMAEEYLLQVYKLYQSSGFYWTTQCRIPDNTNLRYALVHHCADFKETYNNLILFRAINMDTV